MTKFRRPTQALLWTIAVYHITLGGILIYSGDLSIQVAKTLFAWTVAASPELGVLGEILGCYAIAFGLMMATAASDPLRHRSFITVGIVLFALRLFQRLYFADKTMEIFQVPVGRYWSAFVFIFALMALLALVRWVIHREQAATAGRGVAG